MKILSLATISILPFVSFCDDVQIIDGHKWVCTPDGICRDMGPVEESEDVTVVATEAAKEANTEVVATIDTVKPETIAPRVILGTRSPSEFFAFLEGHDMPEANPLADKSLWLVLAIALAGGLLMNLTPCVLPMMPINLMVIGRSAARGALYGLGLMLTFGTLGILAAFFGHAFGEIQGNPLFNLLIAAIFVALSFALFGKFAIDFSKFRGDVSSMRARLFPGLFAFVMGVVGAVLAGACIAPIIIAVLAQSALLASQGKTVLAVLLPFVLGLGMALPWPLAGAGLKILPKPGAWMQNVNRLFAVIVLCFAAWYGWLAYKGLTADAAPVAGDGKTLTATPATFTDVYAMARERGKPVFVDCWALWCKNCLAMEKTTLADERIAKVLSEKFTVIKLEVTDDMEELKKIPGFKSLVGLPAYLVFPVNADAM